MKLYAAAKDFQSRSSDNNTKDIYRKKAEKYERKLKQWLNDKKNTS